MKTTILSIVIALVLAGCATSPSTSKFDKVIQIGGDTYTINEHSSRGPNVARTAALQLANKFASSKGKYMVLLNERSSSLPGDWGYTYTYEMNFRVVGEDDPEYYKPTYKAVPDIVVESE